MRDIGFWALAAWLLLLVLMIVLLRPHNAILNQPQKAKQKQPAPFSNIVLVVLAIFLLMFIVCMIITFWVKGAVPDTLIQYTMGAGGVEAVLLAGIKISKVLKGEKEDANKND